MSTAAHWRVGTHDTLPCHAGLILCWSCADKHSCWEFVSTLVLSYPKDTASLQASPTSCPYNPLAPTSKMILSFGGMGVTRCPTYDWARHRSCSLHFYWLWASVWIDAYYIKKLLWDVIAGLIKGCRDVSSLQCPVRKIIVISSPMKFVSSSSMGSGQMYNIRHGHISSCRAVLKISHICATVAQSTQLVILLLL